MASHSGGPSAYAGGGMAFGDDDPFADDVPQGALELDLPSSHTANAPRSIPAERPQGPPGSVPDLALPAPSQPRLAPSVSGAPPSSPSFSGAPPSSPSFSGAPPSSPSLSGAPPSSPSLSGAPPSSPSLSGPPRSHPSVSGAPPGPPPPPGSSRVAAHVAVTAPPDPAAMIARFPRPPAKVWEAPVYAMKVLWRQLELRQDLASLRKRRSPDVALYERALTTHDTKTFTIGLAITCAGLTIATLIFFLPVILRFMRAD
ncbi:MAG: hypothetical protein KF850_31990 [Labilithrix sp.]|nr:hypothetical protein [Labilithrix sp.]MBX3216700.1 hypothetical protein [Labilithrix sp.]